MYQPNIPLDKRVSSCQMFWATQVYLLFKIAYDPTSLINRPFLGKVLAIVWTPINEILFITVFDPLDFVWIFVWVVSYVYFYSYHVNGIQYFYMVYVVCHILVIGLQILNEIMDCWKLQRYDKKKLSVVVSLPDSLIHI